MGDLLSRRKYTLTTPGPFATLGSLRRNEQGANPSQDPQRGVKRITPLSRVATRNESERRQRRKRPLTLINRVSRVATKVGVFHDREACGLPRPSLPR